MINRINKKAYADMYGPTIGDKIRLADTDLIIEIEKDYATYGEEVKFGGGKVIRDGMGQSQLSKAEGAVDTVITNAIIIDYWGIIKADIGIIDGKFSKIGKQVIQIHKTTLILLLGLVQKLLQRREK